ncbi:RNA 3'-phosphate cyclase [Geomonas sp. Red69]|uniref:RNA 3'-terminal phosphate cyclase n=1 Tax=Geomonas diazotrophica TaxID=2843197 RepID=UPI001C106CDB|nr:MULTISPECIES: RNA 3'-terminal phosphate cyclase [Geomonas]MBU5636916.1 RNA 3'-phosphate cyclase [Geomonas diazotrophica]QXE87966.1 RNA 3'-phosphate cyclase [Geomonas nitrogeniifigens]
MIEIDGSMGEGGGQVLRSALSLSCLTGQGFHIYNIRKNRSKSGLMRQHLMAVQAASRIAAANVVGDRLGSPELSFLPDSITPGEYSFDIGTAGSATLVLQTVIPPLLAARKASRVTVTGGTHVPFSPSWNYFEEIFWPSIVRLGVRGETVAHSFGFYPKGGGRIGCLVEPAEVLAPCLVRERGRLTRLRIVSAVGNLPRHIAERQLQAALAGLKGRLERGLPMEMETREVSILGQGTFIFIKGEYEHAVAGFTGLGERGKPAEAVGAEAASEFLEHHESGEPIDPHLADQLVLYLVRGTGSSFFRTSRVTRHLATNLLVAGRFLKLSCHLEGREGGPGGVTITPHR